MFAKIMSQYENFREEDENDYDTLTLSKVEFLSSEFRVSHSRAPYTFSWEDLDCLRSGEWINDEVLNSYIMYMAVNANNLFVGFTNSFFYRKLERDGAASASCWFGIKNGPIDRFHRFLVPICCGVHWILGCFDFVNRRIVICDSFHHKYDGIMETLSDFLHHMGYGSFEPFYESVPRQHNGDDCGVFVMQFSRCYLYNLDFNCFSQRDIPRIRKQIRMELSSVLSE